MTANTPRTWPCILNLRVAVKSDTPSALFDHTAPFLLWRSGVNLEDEAIQASHQPAAIHRQPSVFCASIAGPHATPCVRCSLSHLTKFWFTTAVPPTDQSLHHKISTAVLGQSSIRISYALMMCTHLFITRFPSDCTSLNGGLKV